MKHPSLNLGNHSAQRFGYYDTYSGLYKLGARYDPSLGRFTQYDPSGQDANSHAYGAANPASFVDPSGTVAFLAPLVFAGPRNQESTRLAVLMPKWPRRLQASLPNPRTGWVFQCQS